MKGGSSLLLGDASRGGVERTTDEHVAPAAAQVTYCAACNEDVMVLVDDVIGGEKVGHCPTCGSPLGLHEMKRG